MHRRSTKHHKKIFGENISLSIRANTSYLLFKQGKSIQAIIETLRIKDDSLLALLEEIVHSSLPDIEHLPE